MIDPDLKRQFDEYMRDPLGLPDEWKAWLIKYIEASGLTLPIGQSIGYANAFSASTPSGVIFEYGGAAAPANFLLCDGSAVSRTTYVNLFTAIGTTYGIGDGSTTFNVPDGRGRVLVGLSAGGPAEVNALGNNDGVTLNNRNVSHDHQVRANTAGASARVQLSTGGVSDAILTTSGDANNTDKPAFLVINYIIKT